MTKFNIPFIFAIIISFLLFSTCTPDNSITGNSDQALAKPSDLLDINSDGDDNLGDAESDPRWWYEQIFNNYGGYAGCFVAIINSLLDKNPLDGLTHNPQSSINSSYDFRDNYLSKSDKGKAYTACYYILSDYGIKNNLIGKYYKEHYELLKSSVDIAHDLQYGSINDQILINNNFAEKLEDMLKIYGNHKNHRDIEPVLEYLELELNKYQNKQKSEIAKDFQ